MSRKFIISEQERNNILKLHKLLNESYSDKVEFNNLEVGKYYALSVYDNRVSIWTTVFIKKIENEKVTTDWVSYGDGRIVEDSDLKKDDFDNKTYEISKDDFDNLLSKKINVNDIEEKIKNYNTSNNTTTTTTTVNSLGCLKGDCQNGEGELKSEEGHYTGNFENGKFEGEGELSNVSSEQAGELYVSPLRPYFHDDQFKYTGNFSDGLPEGYGKIIFDNGDKYEGEFYEGKIEGEGTMTFKNGSVYKGEFETIKVDDLKSTYKVKTIDKTIDDLVKYNSERPRVTDVYSNLTTGTRLKGMFKSGSVVGSVLGVEDKGLDSIVKTGLINTYEGKPLQSLSYIASRVPTLKTKMDLELKNPENLDRKEEIKTEYNSKIEKAKKNTKKILPTVKLQNKNIKSIVYETKANENGFFEFENVEVGEYILTVDTKFIFSKSPKYEFRLKNEDDLEFTIIMSKKDFLSFLQKEGNVYNKKLINESIGDVTKWNNLKSGKYYANHKYVIKINKQSEGYYRCYIVSLEDKTYLKDSEGNTELDIQIERFKDYGDTFNEITEEEYKELINSTSDTTTILTVKECENIIEKYYQTYVSLYKRTTSIDDIDKNMLKIEKDRIKSCYSKTFKKLSRKTKDYVKQLTNVSPNLEFLELNLQIQENANIYKLNDKIKNIITEQKEMKSKMLVEKELINKRFDFVVESLIERDDVGNKTFLLELQLEKRKLIKSGYDSLMVQDSFLDVVNTFL